MALTDFQRNVCRVLAGRRVASGESYVAGVAALNELTSGGRVSRDLDLFHDTHEALVSTWDADRETLAAAGYELEIVRERPTFVEAVVRRADDSVLLEWSHDSAYRFFPLLAHADLGAVLHPLDLATNKILALTGRVEARDWVDIIQCDATIQPLGYLAWAASGKDPGLSPAAILEHASRTAHYSSEELAMLAFEGERPDVALLSKKWHEILAIARRVVETLPTEHIAQCVLSTDGPFRGGPEELSAALAIGGIRFHKGSIRGAFPTLRT